MKTRWFKKKSIFYLPKSWQGYLILLIFLLFSTHIIFLVDTLSNSISDTLYLSFPYIVPAFLLYNLIASEKAGN